MKKSNTESLKDIGSVKNINKSKYLALSIRYSAPGDNGKLKRFQKRRIFSTHKAAVGALPELNELALNDRQAYLKDRFPESDITEDGSLCVPKSSIPTRAIIPEALTIYMLWERYKKRKIYQELGESTKTAYRIAFNKLEPLHERVITSLEGSDFSSIEKIDSGSYDCVRDIKDLVSNLNKTAKLIDKSVPDVSVLIELPTKNSVSVPAFTTEELKRLWAGYDAGDKFVGFILLMTYSGMMPQELMNLKKEHIDYETKEINGCGCKTQTRADSPIYIASLMVPILKELSDTSTYTDGRILDMSRKAFYNRFAAAKEKYQLREKTRPYSARHTTATLLEEKGVLKYMQRLIMRHKSSDTTDYYKDKAQLGKEALKAINKIAVRPK